MLRFISACLFFSAAINALRITLPTLGASVSRGVPFNLLVQNSGTETATEATVVFTNTVGGTYTVPGTVLVGTNTPVILPANFVGLTTIQATDNAGIAAPAFSAINVVSPAPTPYYPCYNPCYNPCYTPRNCYNPCYKPKPVCNIPRPRNRCHIRAEDSSSSESYESSSQPRVLYSGFSVYVAEDAQQEQEFQQYEQEQQVEA